MRGQAVLDNVSGTASDAGRVSRVDRHPSRRGRPTRLFEWALWLYALLVIPGSGPRADLPLHALRSTEGIAAAMHAAPLGPAEAGAARAAPTWTGARAPLGSPMPAGSSVQQASAVWTNISAVFADSRDAKDIALGFLAERSLAPPHHG